MKNSFVYEYEMSTRGIFSNNLHLLNEGQEVISAVNPRKGGKIKF